MPRYAAGVPIFHEACEQCFFCDMPGKRENRFATCLNPYVGYVTYESRSIVVKCPKKFNQCEYYKWMIKNKKDIGLIKKYIKRFVVDGYIPIKVRHIGWLTKRIKIDSIVYMIKLFSFYGYTRASDKTHVKASTILLSNRYEF